MEEHFAELLNKEVNPQSTEHWAEYQTAEPELLKPTRKEVEMAVNRMQNNKAPGEDRITSEMIKYAGPKMIDEMLDIINLIWDSERMPDA